MGSNATKLPTFAILGKIVLTEEISLMSVCNLRYRQEHRDLSWPSENLFTRLHISLTTVDVILRFLHFHYSITLLEQLLTIFEYLADSPNADFEQSMLLVKLNNID